jgi:hypothetical protein
MSSSTYRGRGRRAERPPVPYDLVDQNPIYCGRCHAWRAAADFLREGSNRFTTHCLRCRLLLSVTVGSPFISKWMASNKAQESRRRSASQASTSSSEIRSSQTATASPTPTRSPRRNAATANLESLVPAPPVERPLGPRRQRIIRFDRNASPTTARAIHERTLIQRRHRFHIREGNVPSPTPDLESLRRGFGQGNTSIAGTSNSPRTGSPAIIRLGTPLVTPLQPSPGAPPVTPQRERQPRQPFEATLDAAFTT